MRRALPRGRRTFVGIHNKTTCMDPRGGGGGGGDPILYAGVGTEKYSKHWRMAYASSKEADMTGESL